MTTYHVAILTEWARETMNNPARFTIRYHNPANECETFPFGSVGPGRFLATLADVPAYQLAEALAIAQAWAHDGQIVLVPA